MQIYRWTKIEIYWSRNQKYWRTVPKIYWSRSTPCKCTHRKPFLCSSGTRFTAQGSFLTKNQSPQNKLKRISYHQRKSTCCVFMRLKWKIFGYEEDVSTKPRSSLFLVPKYWKCKSYTTQRYKWFPSTSANSYWNKWPVHNHSYSWIHSWTVYVDYWSCYEISNQQNNLLYTSPRTDIPIPIITRINEQLITECSRLPNVHLINHANLFAEGIDLLHDTKHIKRRHIGLFAANLIDAIRGRARQTRYNPKVVNHVNRSPRRQVPKNKYSSYSQALQNTPAGDYQIPNSQPRQQSKQPALSGSHHHQTQLLDQPRPLQDNVQTLHKPDASKGSGLEIPKGLISFLRFIKTFI